jgi:hypothetical protein
METPVFDANSVQTHFSWFLVGAIIFSMTGCAGTKVGKVATEAPHTILIPPRTIAIIVENDSPPSKRVSRRAEQLTNVQNAAMSLSESIPRLLASRNLVVVPAGQRADLVLRCRILNVRSGNEALRVLIGYGAGKAVLQVAVSLIDPNTWDAPPLLSFETSSTTGGMPGAGLGIAGGLGSGNALAVIGPAVGVRGALKQGLAQEVDQTTDRIDQELDKYFMTQNWSYAKPVSTSTSLGNWAAPIEHQSMEN